MAAPVEKDVDPSTGRTVPHKRINNAYMAHQRWLAKQARREEVAKARAEGRTLPPSPLDEQESSVSRFLRMAVVAAIITAVTGMLAGQFLHEDPLWGYRGKWTNWHNYLPQEKHVFTPDRLREFNGEVENRPILLSIKGDVFDVTEGRQNYGKGGAYNIFAGRDASRAFVTGCFQTHLTHDTRGFTPEEYQALDAWHSFYANHHSYHKVGTAQLPPIDLSSPIPPPCKNQDPHGT